MKIMHMIPSLEGGGAERQLVNLAIEQAINGKDVHIAVRRGGVHLSAIIDCSQISLHELGNLRGLSPLLFIRIIRLLYRIRPDIIQTWLPQMDVIAGLAASFLGIPWVLSERTSGGGYESIKALGWLRVLVAKFSSAIVANSGGGRDYWIKQMISPTRIWVISNAIDEERVSKWTSYSLIEKPRVKNIHSFLVVGRLSEEKGVRDVIAAAALLPENINFRIDITGNGGLREGLVDYVNELGLSSKISFNPYDENWWSKLSDVIALISMSRYEGFPNVVLETVVFGCLVIVSDIPAHREILADNAAFFVPINEPVILASRMMEVLTDPSAAQLKSKAAKKEKKWLNPNQAMTLYDEVYKNIARAT